MRSFYAAGGLFMALFAVAGCAQDNPAADTNSSPPTSTGTAKAEQTFTVTYEATSDGELQSITYNVPDSPDTERDFQPAAPWTKELDFTEKESLFLAVAGSPTVNADYETTYPASTCRILVDGVELAGNTSDATGTAICEAVMP